MKKLKLFGTLLACSFLLFSCEKEDVDNTTSDELTSSVSAALSSSTVNYDVRGGKTYHMLNPFTNTLQTRNTGFANHSNLLDGTASTKTTLLAGEQIHLAYRSISNPTIERLRMRFVGTNKNYQFNVYKTTAISTTSVTQTLVGSFTHNGNQYYNYFTLPEAVTLGEGETLSIEAVNSTVNRTVNGTTIRKKALIIKDLKTYGY